MHTATESPANSAIYWSDKTLPVEIYFAPGVLGKLAGIARDGMLAMPRTGMGVGGLLVGRKGDSSIYVMKTIEIPCSHAMGPSFVLTPGEVKAALQLETASDNDTDGVVVGWYRSKPADAMTLSDHDGSLFEAFCSETWQMTMLIQPSRTGPVLATFGFRASAESGGGFRLGLPGEIAGDEFAVDRLAPPVLAPPQSIPGHASPSHEVSAPHDGPAAYAPFGTIDLPAPAPPRPALYGSPAFADTGITAPNTGLLTDAVPEYRPRTEGLWFRRFVVACALLALFGAGAFLLGILGKHAASKRPPLTLAASPEGPKRIAFRWNRAAVNGADSGALIVATDGDNGPNPLRTIPLDKTAVMSGEYRFDYDGHPGLVTATLKAGDETASVNLPVAAVGKPGESDETAQPKTIPEDEIPFESHLPASGISK